MKYEHVSGKRATKTAEADAASGTEVPVRGAQGVWLRAPPQESCFPASGFVRGSVLLGGDGAGEAQLAHPGRVHLGRSLVFLITVVAEITHSKQLHCGLSIEMPHKGEPLE